MVVAAAMANAGKSIVFCQVADGGAGLSGIKFGTEGGGRTQIADFYFKTMLFQQLCVSSTCLVFFIPQFRVIIDVLDQSSQLFVHRFVQIK